MVEQKILMKSLESDVIYYVEGAKYSYHKDEIIDSFDAEKLKEE